MKTACIHNRRKMTVAMARYWYALAKRMSYKVQIVDPWRCNLDYLRSIYPAGVKVYQASTSGRWGKSSRIVTL